MEGKVENNKYSEKNIVFAKQNVKEKEFWLEKLSGDLKKSCFPYYSQKKDESGARFEEVTFKLAAELFPKLTKLSNRSDIRLFIILATAFIVLLEKYTGETDITIGTPIYKQDVKAEFINTVLVLRCLPEASMTFKELLLQVSGVVREATENQNFPLELLPYQLNIPFSEGENFPLFDVSILLENIHEKEYLRHVNHNMKFIFKKEEDHIHGAVEFNAMFYEKTIVRGIIDHFSNVLSHSLDNLDDVIADIPLLSEKESHRLLYEFNKTETTYPKDKTIHCLFEEQAQKTPGKIAVSSPIDLRGVYGELESAETAAHSSQVLKDCCFKTNPYLFQSESDVFSPSISTSKSNFKLLKTHRHNSVLVDANLMNLIRLFDGRSNLESIYQLVKGIRFLEFLFYPVVPRDLLEITHRLNMKPETYGAGNDTGFVSLVKVLYRYNIIELTGLNSTVASFPEDARKCFVPNPPQGTGDVLEDLLTSQRNLSPAPVLLLGDTPGMPTTGLLYIASYLKRNHIDARCHFNDTSRDYLSMKKDIEELLQVIQPRIVAVSMKWFLYIARVLDICKIVDAYRKDPANHASDIKIVVGGNTASYYWEKIMRYDCIDYVVRGDGELPLLQICREEKNIANTVYRESGRIVANPVTYVQDETNSTDIYLSHLNEILISPPASLFGTFFIFTHKGCPMNCLYCGGCNEAQKKTFNRAKMFKRGVDEVRKDIMATREYASTFMFDFDVPNDNLVGYCKKIWEGIDLSSHFCIFNTLTLPSPQLVELAVRTFKYVYCDIDITTLSRRHREQLFSLGLLKPQPSDEEILNLLEHCEKYCNIEVRINLITGLPYFTSEDIHSSNQFLFKILSGYSCFSELHWARLHAQPGALIAEDAESHGMHSYASSFEDFLQYSEQNFNPRAPYPGLEYFSYPYVYFKDDQLNSAVTRFYSENNLKVEQYKEKRRRKLTLDNSLTYSRLNVKAGQLAHMLAEKGVKSGSIIGIMLEPSIEIPLGILAVLKSGCAYLPISPEYPEARIKYMLEDSNAAALLTSSLLSPKITFEKKIVEISSNQPDRAGQLVMDNVDNPNGSAYVIYTSGTTGKPKGVLLSHENLVNYIHWFASKIHLTGNDKSVLTSSFAFDLGYTSIYPVLLNGGEFHIIPRDTYLLAEDLLDYIERHEITYIKVTPSLFRVIVHGPGFSSWKCRRLRLAVVGGEAIILTDIEEANRRCKHLEIINHYGPTEAAIGCIAQFVDFEQFEEYSENPTIGHPINNARAYIVDKNFRLLPVGVPGELVLSGVCLAGGYLNRPELTADKFIDPAHAPLPITLSARLYRTGDLACRMPDGRIRFLGRIDNQVKIRGYRVELGEIEKLLLKHNQISEAVVIDRVTEGGDRYICSYFVPVKGQSEASTNNELLPLKDIEAKESLLESPGESSASSIVGCFEARVAQSPGKTAIQSNGRSFSYDSLNRYADRVAREIFEKYDDRHKLSKQEQIRYKRQMLLHGWGIESQEKLKGTTVFVAGAGGGASPTIMQLLLAGFGTIRICDFDEVELSNLNRQFLHDESRIGMNKALSAQMTINRMNPHVNVIPITEKLTEENVAELVGDATVVFDMFDGLESKFILSRYTASRGIPHLIASMADINAYSAVFHPPHTSCYHCLFDKGKWEEIVAGMANYMEKYEKNPLPVVATSLFMSSAFAVNEAIKIILGLGTPAYGRLVFFNQGGSEELAQTASFQAMTHVFSDHFRRLCEEQGFDWNVGWRGNFLEELKTEPNPECPVCGAKAQEKIEIAKIAVKPRDKESPIESTINPGEKDLQTVALLFHNEYDMVAGALGTLKAGKTCVPLEPTFSLERLSDIIKESQSRIILTDPHHAQLAEKLRNKVNRNIKVIDISRLDESEEAGKNNSPRNTGLSLEPEQVAYLLYAPEPRESGESVAESHKDILRFVRAYNAGLSSNPHGPFIHRYYPPTAAVMIEIYTALLNGGIYSPPGKEQGNGRYSLSQLKEYLLEELPDYMAPSFFVQLDKMPLTPNGKLDRKALPEPVSGDHGKAFAAPRDHIEEKLAEIWSEVLEVEKNSISIDFNFFELGGHSLKVTRLVAKVSRELNTSLPLAEVFENPTIKGQADYIRKAVKDKFFHIEPVNEKDYYALSSTQKRLYVLQSMEPKSTGYNLPQIIKLRGRLDKCKLENTFKKLLRRHESLRTYFEMENGEPVQKVHNDAEIEIEYHTISSHGKGATVEKIIDNFIRPFDLSRVPLVRVGLIEGVIEKSEAIGILIVDMHHIVSDGVSNNILIRDFTAMYEGRELPELKIQYKDFSEWQKSRAQQELLLKQEKYWLEEFAGEIPILDLPLDFIRPAVQGFEGHRIDIILGIEETRKFEILALEKGVTLYMLMLAVFYVFLGKITGQDDICVGTPVAGRQHADLEEIIGPFINTLVLRNYPWGDKSFSRFLSQVKERTLVAFENQGFQFEELVKKVSVDRDTSRNPLFDVMFSLNNVDMLPGKTSRYEHANAEQNWELYAYETNTSKFDLTMDVGLNQAMVISLEYSTRLFKIETIRRFIEYIKTIIFSINKNIEQNISQIAIISEEEKNRLLSEFNNTSVDYPEGMTVPMLFNEQVAKTPGSTAIIGKKLASVIPEEAQWSYGELNDESNRLARVLKKKGVGSGSIVGIMLERSVDMISAVLAVQKTGGAYLPLEPSLPPERIMYMMENSGSQLLVTQTDFKKHISYQGLVIDVLDIEPACINDDKTSIKNTYFTTDPVYVIYTSGSTGRPKGVLIQHDQYINTAMALRSKYHLREMEVNLLQIAGFSVDVFAGDLARALFNGGKLVICPADVRLDPFSLHTLIETHSITLFESTPALIIPFMDYIYDNRLPLQSLKLLILGSDNCHIEDFRRLLSRFGDRMRIINSYGVTEASIDSSFFEEEPGNLPVSGIVPIGKPLPNMTFYILDPGGNPRPAGIAGELSIGGKGVARGYLNHVELTDHRFMPNPFKPGERLYKTGDRARWLPDGNVEFLGRLDFQVKIRGYRIETGEIENRLLEYRDISEALVTARKSRNSECLYLCAYIVSRGKLSTASLREYLSGTLPDYMIPTYFVNLEVLTLTSTGKVDRKSLPDPEEMDLKTDTQYVPPTSPIEKTLVEVWEAVLGRKKIGIYENFFMIGGDSIKTIQIISRMNKAGYKVEMKDIFMNSSISQLAPFVRILDRVADQSTISGEVPLTPIQKEFFNTYRTAPHHYNQAVMFFAKDGLGEETIRAVFKKLQEHHDALRMTYEKIDDKIIQFNHQLDYPLSLQVYDLRNTSDKDRAVEILEQEADRIQAGIDLEKGPLMKLGLFHMDDGDRLLIVIHHLVIDGVSWRILFEDIETLYQACKNGKVPGTSILPLKTDSFKTWAEQLVQYADSPSFLKKEKEYWNRLESMEIVPLKKDFDENNLIKDEKRISFSLSVEETDALLTKVNGAFGTDINDILLTALALGIKESLGIPRVLINLEGHGREEILGNFDFNRTVGWFTSQYPMVLDVSGVSFDASSTELASCIIEVKEHLRRIPQKGIGYGILKYITSAELKKEINFKLTPQIGFNYMGQFDTDVEQISLFMMAKESSGSPQNKEAQREHELEVSGILADKQLNMSIAYSEKQFKAATVDTILRAFKRNLVSLISFCSSRQKKELTPSDFTYKELPIATVQQLNSQYAIEDIYTLSPMQEGMLFHALYDENSSAYFEQVSYRLKGELDAIIVEKSLNRLIKRYDILRSVFIHNGLDRPVQLVLKDWRLDFFNEDIRGRFSGDIQALESYVQEWKIKDRQRPFDLSNDMLMRIGVIQLDDAVFEFVFSHHHILMDGWCIGILVTEFFEIYNSFLQGRDTRLPAVKPYKAYIQWLEKQNKETAKNYWREYLSDYDQPAGVPRSLISPVNKESYKVEEIVMLLDGEQAESLNTLAANCRVTLYTVLQVVWAIILGRYIRNEDVVFGSVVSGRPGEIEDVETMVGLFINTIPVRIRYNAGTPFSLLIQTVQREALDSEPYHYYPLAEIQAESDLKQNLLDHIMVFENFPVVEQLETIVSDGRGKSKELNLALSDIQAFEQTNYDFYIVMAAGKQLMLKFKYNANVYDREWIEIIPLHFKRVFEQFLENPMVEISKLTLLSTSEKEQLLYDFNDTTITYPKHKTIPVLFEEQVERTLGYTAVVYRDSRLTYSQLNNRANHTAKILREKGISSDSVVGLLMDRSLEMVVGILGILKAGGAYLPIEPGTPIKRMISMLEESEALALLTNYSLLGGNSYTRLQSFGLARVEPCLTETRPSIRDLDDLPFPDRSLVDYEKYNRYIGQAMVKNSVALQATRGCPYNCTYCHKIWSKKHVMRSAENIFKEVRIYYHMGVKRFVFIDDIFNLSIENSKLFFQMVISNRLDVQFFFPNGIRGDILTKEYIDLMVRAGTVNLAMALETASPRLQTLIKKNLDLEKLHENIQYFSEKYPHVIVELFTMHGFPTETKEEAGKTLDFIKSLKWVHFPYVFVLKIYPNTEMAELALRNGVSEDAINRSEDLAFHELPDTLPFDKSFTLQYQTEFLHEYFLNKERLLHVLPYQMKLLTEDELVQKYDSYLDEKITSFSQLLELVGITREELGAREFVKEESIAITNFNKKLKEFFPAAHPSHDSLRVLLLDLSQYFSDHENMLYNVVDPPLGLMYLMSSLNENFGDRVNGRIAKSRIDFDSYNELKQLLFEFKPHVIGIRTLTFYKDFFHKTVGLIRQWGIDVPIISGGPYATSSYRGLLQDPHIDLVVLGEGEITMNQIIEKIIANDKKLPGVRTLKEIPGIVFIPREQKSRSSGKIEIIMLDMYDKELLESPAENPPHVNCPGDLAYMIFTSGSTGKPKGVMVEHRNLNYLVNGLRERVYKNYNGPLNVCMLSPYVFDASVKQIFGALLQGHVLDIVPTDIRLDGDSLIEFYKTHKIDVSDGTPTHIRLLLESISRQSTGISRIGVRHFLIGGEALPKKVAKNFLNIFREAGISAPVITNVYGPTECCVDSSSFDITAEGIEMRDIIPIGKPMPNCRVFILGKYNEAQPVGVAGELCIGGDGVARGYLNQPELSAVKFFNSSRTALSLCPATFLYRSGDLARWQSDGNIEFLGRADHQVKIRGFRIELGEIESYIQECYLVKEAVVLVKESPGDGYSETDRYLAAYIVPHSPGDFSVSKMKEYLTLELPPYMIPGYFVQVERIPLTHNGKVDRKALLLMESNFGGTFAAPRRPVEKKLVDIWSRVLGVKKDIIGIDSNFFELGGHSLKAIIMISNIHKELNIKLPLAQIFDEPTLKELARYIEGAVENKYDTIELTEKRDYYPLSSAQNRLYLQQQLDPGNTAYNLPLVVVLQGLLDKERFEKTFLRLIERHESLRTSFISLAGQPVQKIYAPGEVEFKIEFYDNRAGHLGTEESIIKKFIKAFDLRKAPLMRVGLLKTAEERHILMVDIHHIITDGSSSTILSVEFMALYSGRSLNPLILQYKDYSMRQERMRESGKIREQEEYWLEIFKQPLPRLNLPTDYPRPPIFSREGDEISFELSHEDTEILKKIASSEGATMYMLILGIYNVFLAKLTGVEDIVVGTAVVGRKHVELEQIVGMFVNTVAMRNYPENRKTFIEFLRHLKKITLEAFENQDYPFENLVDMIKLERNPSRNPIFDIGFGFDNIDVQVSHDEETDKPNLKLSQYDYTHKSTKVDLTLFVRETGDRIICVFEYATKLFKDSTIRRFVEYFKEITTAVINNKNIQLKDIEVSHGLSASQPVVPDVRLRF